VHANTHALAVTVAVAASVVGMTSGASETVAIAVTPRTHRHAACQAVQHQLVVQRRETVAATVFTVSEVPSPSVAVNTAGSRPPTRRARCCPSASDAVVIAGTSLWQQHPTTSRRPAPTAIVKV
jgi:hypothetical protein